MHRNIRCSITISKYDLATINPEKCSTDQYQKYRLYWFLHNISAKKLSKISASRFHPFSKFANSRPDTQASIGQPAKYFFTLCKFPSQRDSINLKSDQYAHQNCDCCEREKIRNVKQLKCKYNVNNIKVSKCIGHQKLL